MIHSSLSLIIVGEDPILRLGQVEVADPSAGGTSRANGAEFILANMSADEDDSTAWPIQHQMILPASAVIVEGKALILRTRQIEVDSGREGIHSKLGAVS